MKKWVQRLLPTYQYQRISDIGLSSLKEWGVMGLILDLDDTLTPKNNLTVATDVLSWLEQVQQAGIQCCIVSNNHDPIHVKKIAEALTIAGVAQARKPSARFFLWALEYMALSPEQVLVVGDRLLTDVLGGSCLGLSTCLVDPIIMPKWPRKGFYVVEKWMLKWSRTLLSHCN